MHRGHFKFKLCSLGSLFTKNSLNFGLIFVTIKSNPTEYLSCTNCQSLTKKRSFHHPPNDFSSIPLFACLVYTNNCISYTFWCRFTHTHTRLDKAISFIKKIRRKTRKKKRKKSNKLVKHWLFLPSTSLALFSSMHSHWTHTQDKRNKQNPFDDALLIFPDNWLCVLNKLKWSVQDSLVRLLVLLQLQHICEANVWHETKVN